jgi:hypothetical protein
MYRGEIRQKFRGPDRLPSIFYRLGVFGFCIDLNKLLYIFEQTKRMIAKWNGGRSCGNTNPRPTLSAHQKCGAIKFPHKFINSRTRKNYFVFAHTNQTQRLIKWLRVYIFATVPVLKQCS